ncbi:diacylglycerol/lipid kinase family protein [Chungangia koreensis]|uniref:Diacylglycerol/lipid kinase family protein n=1 Tax=Chungangia koreensis TaxID=752657 RepID=A0ABV8X6N5_9LACT
MLKTKIIVNLKARNGKAEKKWDRFKSKLSIPFEEHITLYPGHARELAEEFAFEAQERAEDVLIVAFGGDGTVHEVIDGIGESGYIRIGAVPSGSGNDFHRGFTLFKNPSDLEKYVYNPTGDAWMDLGRFFSETGQYMFVNSAGIGLDAYIAHKVNQSSLKKAFNSVYLGQLTYSYFLFQCLLKFRPFNLTVQTESDKMTFANVWLATVSNQPYFGGGMKISPKSEPDDGQIELTVVHRLSAMKLLVMFISVFFGMHTKMKEVTQLTGKSFSLTVDEVIHRHADGEYAGMTIPYQETRFEVKPARWKLANCKKKAGLPDQLFNGEERMEKMERGS